MTAALKEVELTPEVCPILYMVISVLSCPSWCELAPDHDKNKATRTHCGAIFELPGKALVQLVEVVDPCELPSTGHVSLLLDFRVDTTAIFSRDEATSLWEALKRAYRIKDAVEGSVEYQDGLMDEMCSHGDEAIMSLVDGEPREV